MNPTATVVAPIGGVVVDRQVGPGQYVQAGGGTPVFTIADPSSVWLLANVRETDAGSVQLGQAVEVHVLAYPARTFKARVTYVAALVDPVTHRLPVRAAIENPDGALKPEMFANFRILTSDASNSPAVPQEPWCTRGMRRMCGWSRDDGLLAYRAIRTGRSNDGLVEVLEGLKAGERIVTKGGLFIDQVAAPAALHERDRQLSRCVSACSSSCCWSWCSPRGVASFLTLNIEAYPDPVPPLVDIVTQSTGQSAEEIERYITIPLEIQMAGIPQRASHPHDLVVRAVGRQGSIHLRLHI